MLLQMATFHSFEWLSSIPFFFPDSSVGKDSACNVGDLGSISGLGRSPGEGKGYPLQYSGLENPMGCIDLSRVGKDQAIHIYTYTHTYRDRDWERLKAGDGDDRR